MNRLILVYFRPEQAQPEPEVTGILDYSQNDSLSTVMTGGASLNRSVPLPDQELVVEDELMNASGSDTSSTLTPMDIDHGVMSDPGSEVSLFCQRQWEI